MMSKFVRIYHIMNEPVMIGVFDLMSRCMRTAAV